MENIGLLECLLRVIIYKILTGMGRPLHRQFK